MVRPYVPMMYVPIAYGDAGLLTAFVMINDVPFPVFQADTAIVPGTDRDTAMETLNRALTVYGNLFNIATFEIVSLPKYTKMRAAHNAAEDMRWAE